MAGRSRNKVAGAVFSGVAVVAAAAASPAAVVPNLTEDFGSPLNPSKFQSVPSDFEPGTGTYTADTTTNAGRLTIAGNTSASFWGGQTVQTVDSFASDVQATISVQRVAVSGTGSAFRSALWIDQQPGAGTGTYLMFSQNVGEGGWQFNNNNTGTGTNIAAFDAQDASLGSVEMKLVYRPLGGTNAAIDVYLDNVLGTTVSLTNWDNTNDFQVRLSGMARANDADNGATVGNDTVSVQFDTLSVQSVPEPAGASLVGLAGLGLLARRRRRG